MRIRNHLLAKYFPELDRYYNQSPSTSLAIVRWCLDPSVIAGLEYQEFAQRVGTGRRRVSQEKRLEAIWKLAVDSVGCEAGPDIYHHRTQGVGCVTCHIGSGAAWFVRANISGAHQVYSVLFNKYSKPIPTPVRDLRPAEGTCEQCHSPQHFFSEIRREFNYYLYDEKNTKSSLSTLLKIGGGNIELGKAEGIHWHMNVDNKIEYFHTDDIRDEIPWVKQTSSVGTQKIYKKRNYKGDFTKLPEENSRRMDCIDCHNRPAFRVGLTPSSWSEGIGTGAMRGNSVVSDTKSDTMRPALRA